MLCFDARKPDFVALDQHRRRPVFAFAQSNQSPGYSLPGKYSSQVNIPPCKVSMFYLVYVAEQAPGGGGVL